MRRAGLLALLVLLLGVVAVAAAGCGGEEEAAPTAETVEGGDGETETAETETEGTTTAEGEETETEGGATEGDAQAGEAVFNEAGCGGCHVLEAAGSSGQVGPSLDESQPDFDLVVERVTNGQGAMPSFKDQLSEEEIRNVAAYVVESTSG
jgi:mono/diheme cytochrome c family protein